MFDHVEFSVASISAARGFYAPFLLTLGAEEIFCDEENGELGFGTGESTDFLLTGGKATTPKMHICFRATQKDMVERAYDAAIAGGGTCNGKPGYRDAYGPGYFAAFVIDPDGHNIEVLFRETA